MKNTLVQRPLVLVASALVWSALNLHAQTAPTITTQPVSQTNLVGTTASFSVAVAGTGPFHYQWQFNGTNLPNNIITTVAGNGSLPYSGDGGPATNAGLTSPSGVAFDFNGNLCIADPSQDRVRMVNSNGIINTVAGNGNEDYSGDDVAATNTTLYGPSGVAFGASGNWYIADTANERIRMVDANGIITTLTGNTTNGYNPLYGGGGHYTGDGGPATNATVNSPSAVALDTLGNIYFSDTGNNRIRKLDTLGYITTVAGNGAVAFAGDGGPAIDASLNNPIGVF